MILYLCIAVVIGVIISNLYHMYKANPPVAKETIDPKKLMAGVTVTDPVLWIKDILSIFNIRKLIIYLVVFGVIGGWFYYKGIQNTPAKVNLGYGKEVVIKMNNEQLHIAKDGSVYVEDAKTGKVLRQIKVKDIPELQKVLYPIGLKFRPIVVAGASYGTNNQGSLEIGAGFSFLRLWKASLEAFITTYPAVYLGCSYEVTDNFGIGIAAGKSLRDVDETRIIVYGRWRF